MLMIRYVYRSAKYRDAPVYCYIPIGQYRYISGSSYAQQEFFSRPKSPLRQSFRGGYLSGIHGNSLFILCIEHSNKKRFLIYTDSMSCLQALDHLKIDHPIIKEIISKLTLLKASGFDIHLCWLPGHVAIRGNECAERAAKTARRTDRQTRIIQSNCTV